MAKARRRAVAVLLAVVGTTLAGCGTTINHILAEPGRYADRDVTLSGEVVKSSSVLGRGAYMLDDGTGTLWVVTKTGAPRQGARVKVNGRVRDVVNLGGVLDLPPEVGSGLVMVEKSHKAK
jgi:hypothetical protein